MEDKGRGCYLGREKVFVLFLFVGGWDGLFRCDWEEEVKLEGVGESWGCIGDCVEVFVGW